MDTKALSELFCSQALMEIVDTVRSTDGIPSPRVKHERCGKDFVLYFNAKVIAIKQNGCACEKSLVKSDVEQAFGLSEELPWAGETGHKAPSDAGKLHVIVPPSIMPGPESFFHVTKWSPQRRIAPWKVYEYKNAQGDILCWQCRYNNPDKTAKHKKEFHQYFLVETPEGPRFQEHFKNNPVDIPVNMLYGLELWDPARPTLLVEGEKAADGARQKLPTWNVLSWNQGRDGYAQIDFSFLKGQTVLVWPDNDKAGIDILEKLANKLATYGIKLKTVINSVQVTWDDGWDLGDELMPNMNLETRLSEATLVEQTVKTNDIVQQLDQNIRRIEVGNQVLFADIRPRKFKNLGLFYGMLSRNGLDHKYATYISIPGAKKEIKATEAWIRNTDTPVLQGVTFDPTTLEPIVDNKLNNFIGFPFESVKPGREQRKMLMEAYRLLRDIVPKKEERRWIIDYAADIFQSPGKKPPTFLTLVGGQGVGKSLLVHILRHLLGDDYMYCAKIDIEPNTPFNMSESGALLLWQDEIKIPPGTKGVKIYNSLKDAVTASTKVINRKNIPQTAEPSLERRIFTSNHDVPFQISHDDRRTTVVKLSSIHQNNREKFKAFGNILENHDLATGMMWFFLNTKIVSDLTIGIASEVKEELVNEDNTIISCLITMLNDCELPVFLADLFVKQDLEAIGTRPVKMGRTYIKEAFAEQFGKHWLVGHRKLWDQVSKVFEDPYRPGVQAQGSYNVVDAYGNAVKKNNSYYMFTSWVNMRANFDKAFYKFRWSPIVVKPYLAYSEEEPDKDASIL